LAVRKPTTEITLAAQNRIKAIQAEAQAALFSVKTELLGDDWQTRPKSVRTVPDPKERFGDNWQETTIEIFGRLKSLEEKYGLVPVAGDEISTAYDQLVNDPIYAAILREPKAAELVATAKELEANGHHCCAYLIYRDAAELSPAASSRDAAFKVRELSRIPGLEKSARECREIQQCHAIYAKAADAYKTNPNRSKLLIEEIVRRAPHDSKVYAESKRILTSF
jgi:hypothetical protein